MSIISIIISIRLHCLHARNNFMMTYNAHFDKEIDSIRFKKKDWIYK